MYFYFYSCKLVVYCKERIKVVPKKVVDMKKRVQKKEQQDFSAGSFQGKLPLGSLFF